MDESGDGLSRSAASRQSLGRSSGGDSSRQGSANTSHGAFQHRPGGIMTLLWRAAPWFSRLLLLLATVLFLLIGLRYLSDPLNKAAADAISLGSVMAISRVRVGFGGFPLALSLILFGCLLSSRRLLIGLSVL